MSSNMNSRSITDYILKLEKENAELKKYPHWLATFEETRTTINKLERRLDKAHQAKVDALNDLNDLKCENRNRKEKEEKEAIGKLLDAEIQRVGRVLNEPSYTDSTARVCGETPYCKNSANACIVERLLELGEMTSDFHKTGAYQGAAKTIAELEYAVESGESVRHLNGIGKSISAKIDERLDEEDSDYDASDCSDSESIASNELSDEDSETEYDPDEEVSAVTPRRVLIADTSSDEDDEDDDEDEDDEDEDDEDFHVTFHTNVTIADELANLGALEKRDGSNEFKVSVYMKAAKLVYSLDYEVLNGTDLMKLGGIGKGIAEKIDEIIQYGSTRRAHDLKQKYPDMTC